MIGKLIVVEGVSGVGKSYAVREIDRALARLNLNPKHVVTREPGGTQLGMDLRNILVDRYGDSLSPHVEALLFMADRAHLYRQVIVPALHAGSHVICDRNWLSTFAYQGDDHTSPDTIMRVAFEAGVRKPDMIVYLRASRESVRHRIERDENVKNEPMHRFRRRTLDNYDAILERYELGLARLSGCGVKIERIDADGSITEARDAVVAAAGRALGIEEMIL